MTYVKKRPVKRSCLPAFFASVFSRPLFVPLLRTFVFYWRIDRWKEKLFLGT